MTKAGRLLLMSGLTFHSGRRLADYPELVAALEAEAWNAALEAVQELAEDGFGPITWLRDLLDSLRKEMP